MPSPGLQLRKRVHSADPRLLSFGRCRSVSLSPQLEEEALVAAYPPLVSDGRSRSPSPPLEDELVIHQIVMMFSMEVPRPDQCGIQYLIHELKAVGLPYHLIFNKVDMVSTEALAEWQIRSQTWGVPVTFISLHSHSGLQDVQKVFGGKSTLLLGLRNVGKTTLVKYITQNRTDNSKIDMSTIIKKVDKWLLEKCDASLLMKADPPQNPHLRQYCLDLYDDKKSRNVPFLVPEKSSIVKKMLETRPPMLDEIVNWVSRIEESEEYSYFMKFCPENEQAWWIELNEKNKGVPSLLEKNKAVSSAHKRLLNDYRLREVMKMLYKACLTPCEEHEYMLLELLRLVNESRSLLSTFAHGAQFIATCVTLMVVGQESTKVAAARLLHALADGHYLCKVLVGELGGFHALTELIQSRSAEARSEALKTLCVLLEAEENWKKVLVTGLPEGVIRMLAQDQEGALPMASNIFSVLGSFELCWSRFFASAVDELKDTSTSLSNAVLQSLLLIKHRENIKIEFLEGGSLKFEWDNETLNVK